MWERGLGGGRLHSHLRVIPALANFRFADNTNTIRKSDGAAADLSMVPRGTTSRRPISYKGCYVTADLESRKWSDDENRIAAIQRRCQEGSRHRCVDERACR